MHNISNQSVLEILSWHNTGRASNEELLDKCYELFNSDNIMEISKSATLELHGTRFRFDGSYHGGCWIVSITRLS